MSIKRILLLLLPAFVLCNRSPLIEIEQGKIRGVVKYDWKGGRFYSFLKVPYAKPPVGELRFKDPEPAERWRGILEATEDMPRCVQFDFSKQIVGEEDCLYLNIHTPLVSTKSLKPVMVFIHGGGYVEGTGRMDEYGPEFLVPEGVVLVTLNYRLGIFGFLNFDNPKIGVPGNSALKDQSLALKWIRKNIEIFGGDPKSITLFGESAGAASTHMHMLSPLSQGIIHRAIIQSGSAFAFWNVGRKNTGILVAELLNQPTENEAEVLEYLQSASVDDIMKVQINSTAIAPIHELPLTGPIVETLHKGDIFLSEPPEDIITRGRFTKIPLMVGYNNEESLILYAIDMMRYGKLQTFPPFSLIPHSLNIKEDEAKTQIFNRIKKQYVLENYAPNTKGYSKLISDVYIAYASYLSVKEHSRVNHKDLYMYLFGGDTKLNYIKRIHEFTANLPGATHVDDLGYLFKNKFTPDDLSQDSIEGQNIQRMVKLWTNFAKFGKPTVNEKELDIKWTPVKKNSIRYMEILTDSLLMKDYSLEDMTFWDKLLSRTTIEHTEL